MTTAGAPPAADTDGDNRYDDKALRPAKKRQRTGSVPAEIDELSATGAGTKDKICANSSQPNADDAYNLPPELWSLICDFLPYSDVLIVASLSKFMLNEVMSSIKVLHIFHPAQLHVGLASRYHNVQDVYAYCLLQPDSEQAQEEARRPYNVNEDAAGRIVPFLTRFPKLQRAFLGGLTREGDATIGFVKDLIKRGRIDNYDNFDLMRQIITALSGAYRAGALSPALWVSGPACPGPPVSLARIIFSNGDACCTTCIQACQSFPLDSVINFHCQGSSQYVYEEYSGSMCSVDVCLSREQVEAIVSERPGGEAILTSPNRILELLRRGTRYVVCNDDGRVYNVVKYEEDDDDVEALELAIQRIGVNELKPQAVVDAIMRSFADDDRDALPPREQCYLAESSFKKLKEYGLPIHEADFLNEDEWEGDESGAKSRRPVWRFC